MKKILTLILLFTISNVYINAYASTYSNINKRKQIIITEIKNIDFTTVVSNLIRLNKNFEFLNNDLFYEYAEHRFRDYLYIIGYIESNYFDTNHIYEHDKSFFGINTKYHNTEFLTKLLNRKVNKNNLDNKDNLKLQVEISIHIWLYNTALHFYKNKDLFYNLVKNDYIYYFTALYHNPYKISKNYISKIVKYSNKAQELYQ